MDEKCALLVERSSDVYYDCPEKFEQHHHVINQRGLFYFELLAQAKTERDRCNYAGSTT